MTMMGARGPIYSWLFSCSWAQQSPAPASGLVLHNSAVVDCLLEHMPDELQTTKDHFRFLHRTQHIHWNLILCLKQCSNTKNDCVQSNFLSFFLQATPSGHERLSRHTCARSGLYVWRKAHSELVSNLQLIVFLQFGPTITCFCLRTCAS